jgi:predicted RNA polymerase sigma factor
LQRQYSPIAALNRTYALLKVRSKKEALAEALKIDLNGNHFYHALLAELYEGNDNLKQIVHLKLALDLAQSNIEKKTLELKIEQASTKEG